MGNGGYGQSIAAPFCRSFLLTLFLCSCVGSPGLQLPSGVFTCSGVGFTTGCSTDICSTTVSSIGCPTMVSSKGRLLGNLCSSAPNSSSFCPHLGVRRAVSHTFFSLILFYSFFLPFLKPLFLEVPLFWLRGSAMPCGRWVGAGWNHPCPARGSPGPSSQSPLQPLLPEPGHLHHYSAENIIVNCFVN